MTLIILGAILTVISVVISYYLSDRRWRRKLLLVVGIVGAALAVVQGYRSLERADHLQDKLDTLAEKSKPRTLTSAQQESIASQMRQFAGTQYDAAFSQGVPDAEDLLGIIEKSLDDAGWKETTWAAGGWVLRRAGKPAVLAMKPNSKDVVVAFAPGRESDLEHIAAALASALSANGIATTVESENINYNTEAIHILIGRKT